MSKYTTEELQLNLQKLIETALYKELTYSGDNETIITIATGLVTYIENKESLKTLNEFYKSFIKDEE